MLFDLIIIQILVKKVVIIDLLSQFATTIVIKGLLINYINETVA